MKRLLSFVALLSLSACSPIQAENIESMATFERNTFLEARSNQELCNAYTNQFIGAETKKQTEVILKSRNINECHGKFGAYARIEGTSSSKLTVEVRELSSKEKTKIETDVKSELKDPNSAVFKWLPFIEGKHGYCGYVNAKNMFGGYTGNKLFHIMFMSREGKIITGPVTIGKGVGTLCADYFQGV